MTRCDNGPEFLAHAFVDWCRDHAVEIRCIQPGKPNQNVFVEHVIRSFRDGVLGLYLFSALDDLCVS